MPTAQHPNLAWLPMSLAFGVVLACGAPTSQSADPLGSRETDGSGAAHQAESTGPSEAPPALHSVPSPQDPDTELCQQTRGIWDPTACGPANCGEPSMLDCIAPACHCPATDNWLPDEGCVEDPACAADDPPRTLNRLGACLSDGSIEWCLPDTPDAIARLAEVAPDASCGPGGGRAGCLGDDLLLCMLDTAPYCGGGSRIDAEGWALVVRIHDLPDVVDIVPTWFE